MQFYKRLALISTAAMAAAILAPSAMAQDAFPSGPIEIISHASAGGGTDTTLRTMQPALEKALGVPVSIAVKTGGSGRVAMSYAKGRPADGYTLMLVTPTHLYTMAQGNSPVGIDEIVGIARASDDPILIVTRADGDLTTAKSMLEHDGSPLRWGTTHVGSVDHASAEVFAREADIDISVVPFEGGGELVINLMGGSLDVASLNLTEAMDAISRGDLTAVAIMAPARVDTLPDTPTTAELGLDADFSTVRGLVAMKGVPQERLDILEKALLEAMAGERYQDLLINSGMPMNSPAPGATWDPQLRKIHVNAVEVLTELGMVK
ncbi:Bug family tripartite tricarboxylate transporter substrate binding protein [Hoeflea ulvae]|uniref:Tripartite tricarboxylate transporter substrate binding protein n=1 Tax=Hoeflea ulvae TaxID=2983764 RepID=A0ABT3YM66_9HYPH|nr:tripartite tricarboxylate transporter substrate binding protein [Hoeflea ulvae]MCY0096998.1 tripartite tricarboxylate transporter substrate binding protein [Hoeflea ulvae]